jgi:predicted AlkP superfamily pyrophosphatase or phosphodiesterase
MTIFAKLLRTACAFTTALLLAGYVAAPDANARSAAPPPKLMVFLVVDGLPQRQVLDYRDQLAPDGLARFLDHGAWFANAHYGYSFTVTAAGHSTMLTGAYPHRTGIIGNEWYDPANGQPVYNTADTSAVYLDGHKTEPLDGTSPKNLQAQTVGDMLRAKNPASKVIAISGKDRGAILPAGKTGTAYMYMHDTGGFASTSFYMKEHPAWVKAFNDKKPADRYFKTAWTPLLDNSAYARSLPDEQPWYAAGGKLPMVMGEKENQPNQRFYEALLRSPFADTLTLEFARAAIAGESLGRSARRTDILAVSLSGHDYVNHAFGAESRLSHDHLLQLDRLFQAFFHDLDATVGKGNYIAVLTADHGFMPAPEYSKSLGRDAGRINTTTLLDTVNQGLVQRFGPGRWATHISASALLLDRPLMARQKVDVEAMRDEARRLLLTVPGIGWAYTWRELDSNSLPDAPFFRQMQNSFNKAWSGDVQFVVKPYWMLSNGNTGTTHGSPHAYDTQVPILFYGPRWIKTGKVDAPVEEADLAPTLAKLLNVSRPPQAEGKLLPLP